MKGAEKMSNITWNFSGKVVVITGSATGIGRGTALQFAKAGANLALCDFNFEEVSRTAEKCRALTSGKVKAYKMDVTNVDEIAAAKAEIVKDFGTVDVLFSNAGVSPKVMGPPISRIPISDWERTYQVNTLGMVKVCNAFCEIFKEKKAGKIIITSSAAAWKISPLVAPYGASKIAVVNFAQALSMEMGEYNTNVNVICPGFVYTNIYSDGTALKYKDILGGALNQYNDNESVMNYMASATSSLHRPQSVDDMAYTVMFLASEEASEITGSAFNVDSGYIKKI
ncbi:MAG: SDR family oxidoreductase [Clostridia bacterium]|nr:SDR family oxidoreductase [Clostridia bacterium]